MNQPQPFGPTWASAPHVQVGDDVRYAITTRPQSYDVPAGVTIRTRTGAGALVATTIYTVPALFALVRDAGLALERIEAATEVTFPVTDDDTCDICGTSRDSHRGPSRFTRRIPGNTFPAMNS